MRMGLLWHDSTSKHTVKKVADAATRYAERFGHKPNTCYVNPTQLPDRERKVEGVLVRPSSRVLRHHFWIGVESEQPVPAENDNPS